MSNTLSSAELKRIVTAIQVDYPFPVAFEIAVLQTAIEYNHLVFTKTRLSLEKIQSQPSNSQLQLERDQQYKQSLDTLCEQARRVMWFASRYLAGLTVGSYWHFKGADLRFAESESEAEYEKRLEEISKQRRKIRELLETALRAEISGIRGIPINDHPSELRQWFDVVFAIIEFWQSIGTTPFVPELLNWASKENQSISTELSKLYGYVLSSRAPEALEDYFRRAYDTLLEFLASISFVTHYPLVKVWESNLIQGKQDSSGAKYAWELSYLMGDKIQTERKVYDSYSPCPEDRLQTRALSVLDRSKRFQPALLPLEPLTVLSREPAGIDDDTNPLIALIDDWKDDAEKQLRYRLVTKSSKHDHEYISLDDYVSLMEKLLTQSTEPKVDILSEQAGWAEVRDYLNRQGEATRKRIGGQKYLPEHYLERAAINYDLDEFLKSDFIGMLIVGDAGVGKTNLMCHLSEVLQRDNDWMVLLHDCRDFKASNVQWKDIEHTLIRDFGFGNSTSDWQRVLRRLEEKRPLSETAQLVLLFDALNEHPEAHRLLEILARQLVTSEMPRWLKVIVTCRSEPWERSLKYRLNAANPELFYRFSEAGEPTKMSQFNEEEVRRAYTEKYKMQPWFDTLPRPVQQLLMDPLMLGLAHRVYAKSGLPVDVHRNRILREYLHTLVPPVRDDRNPPKEQKFLTELLKMMYASKRTEVTLAEASENTVLQEAYDSSQLLPNHPYIQLVSALLRDAGIGNAVTFRYERVFEFALSEYILHAEAVEAEWKLDWFESKVKESVKYPSLWGALRSLLVDYWGDLGEPEKFYGSLEVLGSSEFYELSKLLAEALVSLTGRVERSEWVKEGVQRLIKLEVSKQLLPDARRGELAVSVAQRLKWGDLLERGAKSSLVTVRVASVQAIYYFWRRDQPAGLELMKRIAQLVKGEVLGAVPELANRIMLSRLGRRQEQEDSPLKLFPLTSSLLNLSMMMVSHCLREPDTAHQVYEIWEPILKTIPAFMEKPIEQFVQKAGAQLMLGAWGATKYKPDSPASERKREGGGVINVRSLKAFYDLPLGHENRRKVIQYLEECDPAKGRLTPILEEVVELARIPDAIVHFVPQILFLTRGHEFADDVLEICSRLCLSDNPYDRYEGMIKMGVYSYSVDHPPEKHMEFMREQVLWTWRGRLKLFRLAGEDYLLDQSRFPIMYECSAVGRGRTQGQVAFVQQIREQPWDDDVVDRDLALIHSLGEAAVFGHITFNTNVIPILETLQIWFEPKFYATQDPKGRYFKLRISEGLAAALARIRAIYPDEVERYLSFAPANLRELTAHAREDSAASAVFTGGQASLPWLVSRTRFRLNWVKAMIWMAKQDTSVEQGFQTLGNAIFTFDNLRAIFTDPL